MHCDIIAAFQASRRQDTWKYSWRLNSNVHLFYFYFYLQSSKVDPGDESASRLRSSSLSRVTWRSWNSIVSSFSLICLVSVTGGGDDALPVVPDQKTNNWQLENPSKEQYNFTKDVSADNNNNKKSHTFGCRIPFKTKVSRGSFHQQVGRRTTQFSHTLHYWKISIHVTS